MIRPRCQTKFDPTITFRDSRNKSIIQTFTCTSIDDGVLRVCGSIVVFV